MFLKKLFLASASILMLALAYQLGVRSAGASSGMSVPTEVATLSGVLHDGQTIPLPVFADGTTALESECSWSVSLNHMGFGPPPGGGGWWREETCRTEGRLIRCYAYSYDSGWYTQGGDANFLIIATRGAPLPTNARAQSWGSVKVQQR